ncbi:hypothetical protein AB0G74_27740 [Streptomyces sp. NPDC020875]|uniref:hypothetical protein n=1 Tax=Streptomyces sp. NPDC020875 TaxID=3154898 RepID=UPI0033FD6874
MSETAVKDWRAVRQARAARVQESIARAVACPLCPEITPEEGLEILARAMGPQGGGRRWWKDTKTIRERALRLTGDPVWRERALSWTDAYWDEHGHGPTWKRFWNAPGLWPPDTTGSLLNTVLRQLAEDGGFDGTKTPFGLRRRTGTGGPQPEQALALVPSPAAR